MRLARMPALVLAVLLGALAAPAAGQAPLPAKPQTASLDSEAPRRASASAAEQAVGHAALAPV